MAISKRDHLVGLDIGSQSVKIAEIEHGKSGLVLKRLGCEDIHQDLMEDGEIKDPQALSDLIRKMFKQLKIKEKNVALSVGGYSIIVKKINVQTMSEEQLLETIHYEAEQYIPFDINDVNLDFQILGENEKNRNQMSVLLVAAKKDLIDGVIGLVQNAGRTPRLIDVDAFALQNIYEQSYLSGNMSEDEGADEMVALIDIGAEKTSLNILRGATSLFMRDIPMGCAQITKQMALQLDCTLDEAEKMKRGVADSAMPREQFEEILAAFSAEWGTEVRRAFDFFYSSFGEDDIGRIILSGGGAHVSAIRSILESEMETAVETIDPFKGMEINKNRFEQAFLDNIAPQTAIALGLALRRVDDK